MQRGIQIGIIAAGLMAAACPGDKGAPTTSATTPTTGEAPTTTSPGPTTSSTTTPTTTTTTGESPTTSTTGAGALKRCMSLCDGDRDCLHDGEDIGFRCLDAVCAYPACTGDAECLAALSGWLKPCAAQGECEAMEVCVEVEGEGRCALAPGVFACADFGLVELTRAPIEGGRLVTVCGQGAASCVAGECFTPCADDTCPPQMGHPFCEPVTGQCVCQVDQDCEGSMLPGFAQCIDGRCGCASDSDCAGGTNVDTCYAGACGCSSDAACTAMVFDGAPLSCQ